MTESWRSVRISRITCETDRIKSFELSAVDGRPLPAWNPGSHVRVRLPSGAVRQYSLFSDPRGLSSYRIGVMREPAGRGGSAELHDTIREGDIIHISSPVNNFPLDQDESPHILVAGGIGITPILSMARALANEGRDWRLLYCTRTPEDTAFADEVKALGEHAVRLVHDQGDPKKRLDVRSLVKSLPANGHIYVCGPRGLINAVIAEARQANLPKAQVHWEAFVASDDPERQEKPGGSFEIELRRSGKTLTVLPNQTILQVLRSAGIRVESVCEQGYCGTCLTAVLEGIPDHRDDDLLTSEERDSNTIMAVCCSRAKSGKLVLDL